MCSPSCSQQTPRLLEDCWSSALKTGNLGWNHQTGSCHRIVQVLSFQADITLCNSPHRYGFSQSQARAGTPLLGVLHYRNTLSLFRLASSGQESLKQGRIHFLTLGIGFFDIYSIRLTRFLSCGKNGKENGSLRARRRGWPARSYSCIPVTHFACNSWLLRRLRRRSTQRIMIKHFGCIWKPRNIFYTSVVLRKRQRKTNSNGK